MNDLGWSRTQQGFLHSGFASWASHSLCHARVEYIRHGLHSALIWNKTENQSIKKDLLFCFFLSFMFMRARLMVGRTLSVYSLGNGFSHGCFPFSPFGGCRIGLLGKGWEEIQIGSKWDRNCVTKFPVAAPVTVLLLGRPRHYGSGEQRVVWARFPMGTVASIRTDCKLYRLANPQAFPCYSFLFSRSPYQICQVWSVALFHLPIFRDEGSLRNVDWRKWVYLLSLLEFHILSKKCLDSCRQWSQHLGILLLRTVPIRVYDNITCGITVWG